MLDSGQPSEAAQIAGTILQRDPGHARALHIVGAALLMQGRHADAVAPLEAAARGRHNPELDTLLAVALHQAGRHDEALRRLKLATKRHPSYAPAFKELGFLLVSLGRYDEAVEILQRGLKVAPMMPQLSVQLGYALLSNRKCAEAKIAFARAVELSPDSADAMFGMAKAHQGLGDNAGAAEYFRRYLTLNPGDHAARLQLGLSLLELRDRTAGYACFRAIARVDAKHYGTTLNALAAAGRGRFWLKPSEAARFLRETS